MPNPDNHPRNPETSPGRYNRRRIMVLIVVVFVVVLSFFAGRYYGNNKPNYIQPGSQALKQYPGSDKVGIPPGPPDSLSP